MNRRELLVAGGVLGAGSASAQAPEAGSVPADLDRYVGFGSKLSGGPGDEACGAWMEGRLRALGFATRRQPFDTPFLDVREAKLEAGGRVLPLRPQAPWLTTPAAGVAGPLRVWREGADMGGAVAVVVLPYRRWSAFRAREVEPVVRAALAGGAAAVLLVTTGPTGEALALNVTLETPAFSAPVAVLAPAAFAQVAEAARRGEPARVTITGAQGSRAAFNLSGRLDRGTGRWLVISTPRSGWDVCAGERGPGVAVWLDLARWASRAFTDVDILMTSASGHEREYAGARLFLKSGDPPPPPRTAFWLHLGANVAARDWHELATGLRPLPSADPQRVLVVQRDLLGAAREAFQGQPGLEAPYLTEEFSDGEVGEVLAAGYVRCGGVFGAHRFHHALGDDMRCVEPRLVQSAAVGFRSLVAGALRRSMPT